jgi:hypothetical protein
MKIISQDDRCSARDSNGVPYPPNTSLERYHSISLLVEISVEWIEGMGFMKYKIFLAVKIHLRPLDYDIVVW